jgi:hypothetical protein
MRRLRAIVKIQADAGLGGIVAVRLAPDRQHHLLRQVFREAVRRAQSLQISLDPRRIVVEQGDEGILVAPLDNRLQEMGKPHRRSSRIGAGDVHCAKTKKRGHAIPRHAPAGRYRQINIHPMLLRGTAPTGSPRASRVIQFFLPAV